MAKTKNEIRQANYAQTQHLSNRRPWGQEEDKQILSPERPIDRELAEKLGRSVQGIQLRRWRLGGAEPRR